MQKNLFLHKILFFIKNNAIRPDFRQNSLIMHNYAQKWAFYSISAGIVYIRGFLILSFLDK